MIGRKAPELWDVEKKIIQEFENAVYAKHCVTPQSVEDIERAKEEYFYTKLRLMELVYENRTER